MNEWAEGGLELEGVGKLEGVCRRLQASNHLLSIHSAFHLKTVRPLAGALGLVILAIALFYPQLAAML